MKLYEITFTYNFHQNNDLLLTSKSLVKANSLEEAKKIVVETPYTHIAVNEIIKATKSKLNMVKGIISNN